jgi:hypothetical protein
MNGWRKQAEIFGVLVFWGAGLGAIYGAIAATIDCVPEWCVLSGGRMVESVAWGVMTTPPAAIYGAFIGTLLGFVAGALAGAYSLWARTHRSPEFVAAGIRVRILEAIVVAAALSTALAAHAQTQSTFPQLLLAFGLIPGLTALALGWHGSKHMAWVYLRHEVRESAAA